MKVHLPERYHRLIPEIAAFLGVVLAGLGLYYLGPYSEDEWLLGLAAGWIAGWAATGFDQSIKQREV